VTARLRRGSALILVLIMTLSLAALASTAIYMTGSSGLLSRYHDKERDLEFAVETALELGRARLQRDTSLVLYDTGYRQLLTSQAVYSSSGSTLTGLTVDLYAAYTGDTSGLYVPYVTLLATVTDAYGLRLARRMDLQAQSFSRYALFANDFPSSASIGAGENIGGRVHTNNRFIASTAGSPVPAFSDTVSAAGTISGSAQWADTVSSTGGAIVVPWPSASASYWGASTMRGYFSSLANNGDLSVSTVTTGSMIRATSGGVDISGSSGFYATAGSRIEFLTIDVNNNGMIDSTEGFMRVFHLATASGSTSTYYYGGIDSTRLAVNFSGTPVSLTNQIMLNQCGAFYTIGGKREFFPVAMHKVTWVKTRIQTSTYPTVTAGEAAAMDPSTRAGVLAIVQQPTARCFPQASPYLMNVERLTVAGDCTQDWWTSGTRYTFGSAPGCTAAERYGGQDTTFTTYSFTCPVDLSDGVGRCTGVGGYAGSWDSFDGSNGLPNPLPAAVRQNVERAYLWPLHPTYNSASRRVVYTSNRVFVSGTIRGYVTLYVNGFAVLQDDITYDQDPADTTNLCRNLFGLIARDSILVSDNALNRPRVFETPSTTAGNTLSLGGNREFELHGSVMALGGSFRAHNATVATATNPVYSCPLGSSFTAAGGCLHVIGGAAMRTYAAPYSSAVANSGLRPLREADPCQATNRRPPEFPLARTRVRPIKAFDVDPRQVKSATLIRAYFNRLRGARAAP
jgi:hypothetical protein